MPYLWAFRRTVLFDGEKTPKTTYFRALRGFDVTFTLSYIQDFYKYKNSLHNIQYSIRKEIIPSILLAVSARVFCRPEVNVYCQ